MRSTILFTTAALLLPYSTAAGLYTKASPVLQVDARSYDRVITKSNYTSIVEFYAPWCGHCQNLKPAYEKAATAVDGIARVAAVNCDEEDNKSFCSSMGVSGFPTLKIVKPGKSKDGKKARPIVEDYQGARTAKAIADVLADKVPNHVTRLKDDAVEAWVQKEPTKPKVLFFSEKGVVSALIKAVAVDFLGSVDVAFVRSSEKSTVAKYAITSFPSVVLLAGDGKEPETYSGEMKKQALIDFVSHAATPNPDADPAQLLQGKAKPSSSKKAKASSSAKSAKPSVTAASRSTGSEEADATTPNAAPPLAPVHAAPQIPILNSEADLQKSCVHSKSATCILAIMPQYTNEERTIQDKETIKALNEISHKHRSRGSNMIPAYIVPSATNNLAQKLMSELLEQSAATVGQVGLLVINAKRGWWTRYTGTSHTQAAIEDWIDGIRFGEHTKSSLPEGLVQEIQQEEAPKPVKPVQPVDEDDDKPIELKMEDLSGTGGDLGNGLRYEWVEVDEDYVPEQDRHEVIRDEL